jgi:RNA polymerase sigma factor (sigma-70 family)
MTNPISPRALVVEDDCSWQQILSEILTDAGMAVDVTDSLDTAVAILKAESHRLAVVDLSLAGNDHHNRDGLRVLEAVHRLDPGCQSILLTGYATVELAVSVLTEYRVLTLLRKENFQRTEFRQLISRVLASAPPTASLVQETASFELSPSEQAASPHETMTKETILVVEDDAGWRSILSELLNDAGYGVHLCSSFGEALSYLRREKYMLAVVDLSLTGTSEQSPAGQNTEGYQLLTSTKASGISTIVVSGIASPEDIQHAYAEQDIFAYLEKQAFDRNTFLRIIEEACASRKIFSELDRLTDREREVLELLAQGKTNKEIAELLVITTNTVKRHLKAIFEKLDVHTRSAATAKAAVEK